MRKRIVAVTILLSVTAGGLVGAVAGGPSLAGAAQTAAGAAGWVSEALTGLVDDGIISAEQADAVEDALVEARPERGRGHHARARLVRLAAVAERLGISPDELWAALGEGRTIAEIAADNGVDIEAVVDAIAAEHEEWLVRAVADGELTQEQADRLRQRAEERARAIVDGEGPGRGPGGRGPGPRGHGR